MKQLILALALSCAAWGGSQAGQIALRGDPTAADFKGEFTKGTSKMVETFLNKNPQVKDVTLKSRGGLLAEGIFLGRVFDKKGINTHVLQGDYCISACSLAFLGGPKQSMNGTLAFHNGQMKGKKPIDQVSSEAQIIGSEYTTYFLEMGYHVSLPRVVLYNTSQHRYLVFKSKAPLDRYYIGSGSGVKDLLTGWPVPDSEINKRLKGLN